MLYEISEKVFELEKRGEKIYKLNLGEPDWPSSPDAIKAVKKAIDEGKTKYASAQGEKELRQLAAKIHKAEEKNIVVTTGSKWGIFASIYTTLKEGDEVIIFSPHWTAFELMLKERGVKPVIIDLNFEEKWKIDYEILKEKINANTKMIILNNPVNPTSHVYSETVEKEIIEIAKEKKVNVLLDIAYRGLAFKKMTDPTYYDNLITVYSFAKPFGMTGWRAGYVCANEQIVKKITKLNQITLTNTPVFVQYAALEMLKKKEQYGKIAVEYCKERAEVAMKIFDQYGIRYNEPMAGFYIFPKTSKDGLIVANELLDKHKIAVAPGAAFGNYKNFIRISLCYSSDTLKNILNTVAIVAKSTTDQ